MIDDLALPVKEHSASIISNISHLVQNWCGGILSASAHPPKEVVMSINDNIGTGEGVQMLQISEAEEQFYLNHPDHRVRAEFVARRLAQPGSDRREFSDFVHLVLEGIDHEDV